MRSRLAILALLSALVMTSFGGQVSATINNELQKKQSAMSAKARANSASATEPTAAAARYRIDTGQSRFMVEAFSGGLLWFMGHDHHFAIRDFSGEAQATEGTLEPASLQMTVKTASLEETGKNFTEQQKQIINNDARKEVLEAEKYPDIVFKSTNVKAKKTGENQFEAEIAGDLTLHGTTRHITIPARVMLNGGTLRASGEFSVNRSDYNVKTKSIKAGMIRVRDKVKFTFDIVATRY